MMDIFSIFNPDWWMDENNNALQIADAVLFLFLSIPVIYLFICSLFSLGKYKNPYPKAAIEHRFLVLFSVLRNGKEVIESINYFLDTQNYPREKYDIAVAATQLSEEDLITLLQMPVNIVVPDREQCTKVYAIQQAMERYSPNEYDMVVIFNSDNRIVPNALNLFNNAFYSGCDAIQAHRMTENLTTSIAILNAASEEINNNLFRKAHTRMGFSSALIGSAMAFEFQMFHGIAPTLSGSDLTKSMETALLKQNIYTEYMEEVVCYSKKEDNADSYEARRQEWIETQYSTTFHAIKKLPLAMLKGEWDYVNKLFQWLLPSRFLLIALITFCTFIVTILDWTISLKWYMLLACITLTFIMALPEGEIARRFKNAFWALPVLIFASLFSHIKQFKKKKNNNNVSADTKTEKK
ncbi:cellulose synthase/poly-beta-1,6-N-acetylglucosamine synthase-like glycosyltransferase [Bacteroides zoogleoformans]|uniref:Glycosyltransferase n=1 Tax=Bacteroides zoogleoformans TaxID=28119 RepID=A0ABN5IH28_9BACE|nr:glycosyltransferase family 2 protein [Bacteroides zoogleoformans]AVM52045.1 glycosyltransferase [Bacteroides zoogleoformans]TWJ13976.1 cellulose synthase/poly-beta-1,6-N-acetylglucosamine synthase-like glycosyltransferase [Bacteroides zoogleoformans]